MNLRLFLRAALGLAVFAASEATGAVPSFTAVEASAPDCTKSADIVLIDSKARVPDELKFFNGYDLKLAVVEAELGTAQFPAQDPQALRWEDGGYRITAGVFREQSVSKTDILNKDFYASLNSNLSLKDLISLTRKQVPTKAEDVGAVRIEAPRTDWCASSSAPVVTFSVLENATEIARVRLIASASAQDGAAADSANMQLLKTLLDKRFPDRLEFYIGQSAAWLKRRGDLQPVDTADLRRDPGDFCYKCTESEEQALAEGLSELLIYRSKQPAAATTFEAWPGEVRVDLPDDLDLTLGSDISLSFFRCKAPLCKSEEIYLEAVKTPTGSWSRLPIMAEPEVPDFDPLAKWRCRGCVSRLPLPSKNEKTLNPKVPL